jgi:hypothetical protein
MVETLEMNDQWVMEKNQGENLKCPRAQRNRKHGIYKNVWDRAKRVLRGKFIAMSAYLKKKKKHKSPMNNLMVHLKLVGKQEQNKPKLSRW